MKTQFPRHPFTVSLIFNLLFCTGLLTCRCWWRWWWTSRRVGRWTSESGAPDRRPSPFLGWGCTSGPVPPLSGFYWQQKKQNVKRQVLSYLLTKLALSDLQMYGILVEPCNEEDSYSDLLSQKKGWFMAILFNSCRVSVSVALNSSVWRLAGNIPMMVSRSLVKSVQPCSRRRSASSII